MSLNSENIKFTSYGEVNEVVNDLLSTSFKISRKVRNINERK